MKSVDYLIAMQGLYYLITAIWPFVHLGSFEAIAGFKPDKFQLYTTSFLISIIAVTLLMSIKKTKTSAVKFLSLSAPAIFIIVELWYRTSIPPVFMLEAIVEAGLLVSLSYFYLTEPKEA